MKLPVVALLLITFLFDFNETSAQTPVNLVPNGSFELNTDCPNDYSQVDFATPWTGCSIITDPRVKTTPDYHHACGNNLFNVPSNVRGNQIAYQGEGYISINCYNEGLLDNKNEYATVKLTQPLEVGKKYYVSLKISLADNSRYAIKNLGLKFFTTDPSLTPLIPDVTVPDIVGNQFYDDKSRWYEIKGEYIPTFPLTQYIVIGVFTSPLLTEKKRLTSGLPISHYFIDDVVISTDVIPNLELPVAGIKNLNSNKFCVGDCLSFLDSTAGSINEYIWMFEGATPNESRDKKPTNICYQTPGEYSVSLTVINAKGENKYTLPQKIIVNNAPSFQLPNDTAIFFDQPYYLNASPTNKTLNDITYLWNDGTSTEELFAFTPGVYYCTVSNYCGSFTDSIKINKLFRGANLSLAFSPNNDGINDVLSITKQSIPPKEFFIRVYDRWGTVIFESKDPDFSWDGNNTSGVPFPSGVYIAEIIIVPNDDKLQPINKIEQLVITR